MILHSCLALDDCKILILSYNRALCEATRSGLERLGLSDRVQCYTFHGLATYCVRPTYDDMALHELLEDFDEVWHLQKSVSMSIVLSSMNVKTFVGASDGLFPIWPY